MLGQRKLFQRLLPGAMHAAIFWGFLVLFPTIVMAMISAVDRRLVVPVARVAGLVHGARRRLRDRGARRRGDGVLDPQGRSPGPLQGLAQRRGRLHPRDDRARRADPARVARVAHRRRAERVAGVRVVPLELALRCDPRPERRRALLRLGAPRGGADLPRLPAVLEAPAHRHRGGERLLRADAEARPPRAAALRRAGRRDALRRGDGRRPDVEGDGRLVLVHRVRSLPGRLPRVRDREDALAEAPDHGHPRPAARRRRRTCSQAES